MFQGIHFHVSNHMKSYCHFHQNNVLIFIMTSLFPCIFSGACIYSISLQRTECDTSKIYLNSELSWTDYHSKAKELSLLCNLLIPGKWRKGFLPIQKALKRSETQASPSRICKTFSYFIGQNNSRYAKNASCNPNCSQFKLSY